MRYLEEFPQTAFFLGFFVFSCFFAYCPFPVKIVFSLLAVIAIILSAVVGYRLRVSLRILLISVMSSLILAGAVSSVCFDRIGKICSDAVGNTEQVTVEITECQYALSYEASYKAVIRNSESLPRGTCILLTTPMTALGNGSVLIGEVTFQEIENTGSFDAQRYYLSQKIRLSAEDVSLEKTDSRRRFSLTSFFETINDQLSAKISAHVHYDAAGIASAVLLGNRDELSDSVKRDFRRLGITHLLVVSGTHFAVIVSFAERAMRRLRVKREVRAILNIAIVILFMLLTGFTPSVVRAGIMHIMAQLAMLLLKKPNTIHAFALSGALMVLFNPYSAIDCGLQLSFIATSACIFFQQNRGFIRKFIRRLGFSFRTFLIRMALSFTETLLLTAMITLCSLPVMWVYFGEISLISIPVNVLFMPLVTVLMYLTGIYLLLYPLRIFIYPTAAILSGYCGFLGKIAGLFSSLDHIMLPVNYRFSVFFLLPLTILLLLLPAVSKKARRYVLLSAVTIFVTFTSLILAVNLIDRGNTYFSYLPNKGNDGFVLKSEGKTLICEISDASYSYLYNLTDEVSALHSCEIEAIMLTHYHSKHVQLLERLAEREILRTVILPEPVDDREEGIYHSLVESAELHKVKAVTVSAGETYTFGTADITLFDRIYISRSTHPITAVEIEIGDECTVIASCSFNQAVPEISDALEKADYPIFGRHSPVYKKAFGLELNEAKAVLISEDAALWMNEDTFGTIADGAAYIAPESFRMKVSRMNTVSKEVQLCETAS